MISLNGVSPGRQYNVQTIRDAIKTAYGANVKLDCQGNTLTDVSLNFYVKGRSEYMITDVLQQGNCRGAINYPKK
jgi:ribonuclease T2